MQDSLIGKIWGSCSQALGSSPNLAKKSIWNFIYLGYFYKNVFKNDFKY